jgi:hypothetical protein
VGLESYGFGRCSVLVIIGIFKFLLPQKNASVAVSVYNFSIMHVKISMAMVSGINDEFLERVFVRDCYNSVYCI